MFHNKSQLQTRSLTTVMSVCKPTTENSRETSGPLALLFRNRPWTCISLPSNHLCIPIYTTQATSLILTPTNEPSSVSFPLSTLWVNGRDEPAQPQPLWRSSRRNVTAVTILQRAQSVAQTIQKQSAWVLCKKQLIQSKYNTNTWTVIKNYTYCYSFSKSSWF